MKADVMRVAHVMNYIKQDQKRGHRKRLYLR